MTGAARAIVLAVAGLAFAGGASAACDRGPREVRYDGSTGDFYAAPQQWTELIFPEPLMGQLPERPQGLSIRPVPVGSDDDNPLRDRVYISVDSDTYHGGVYFHGESGRSYHLKILARPECANTTVTVIDTRRKDGAGRDGGGRRGRQPVRGPGRLGLVEHMHLGRVPQGFSRDVIERPRGERVIYEQGPTVWYLEEIWRGHERTGFIMQVVNRGRVPYEISLQQIDFSHRAVKAAFGDVREIAMAPFDRRLGPAPEHAVDALHPENRGLIYVMARGGGASHGGQ